MSSSRTSAKLTADIQQFVAESAAIGEEIAAVDTMMANATAILKVKEVEEDSA